ncbi:MAG: hypothetical protein BMS9Abin29_1651 [Gemmatimonadota bacterium]|nr:MAG: hypothetical protein BMS9Abin29_1651 [Gemmatimonadota bacterium]
MLRVDLVRLEREGVLGVEGAIDADDPLFEGSDFRFASPLRVRIRATIAGSGEVVIRGSVQGSLRQECRRCLAELDSPVDTELTLVFVRADELGENPAADVYPVEASATELDLCGPIREELVLTVPSYALCNEDCRGFCLRCGTNRNEQDCQCSEEDVDPRWDALRTLGSE